MDILEKRSEIRGAVWLWLLFNRHALMKAGEKWWPVHGGVPYNDEALASALNVPTATASGWRKRLEGVGLIRSVCGAPRKRSFEILNLAWEKSKPAAELLPDHIGVPKVGEVVQ